jgi:hypothetical protein
MKPTNAPKVYVVIRRSHVAAAFLGMSKAILEAVTNAKTTFPTPTPPLVQLSNDISAFDAAQTAALTRAKGAAQKRNAAMAEVVADLDLLRAYVQTVANSDPANALTIAHSAGMDLRKTPARTKNDLNAKPGTVSGSVAVSAKVAGVRSSHNWEYSTDGGKTWLVWSQSLQGKTTITGLTPASFVLVRHQAVTKAGPQDWSQPISVLVH